MFSRLTGRGRGVQVLLVTQTQLLEGGKAPTTCHPSKTAGVGPRQPPLPSPCCPPQVIAAQREQHVSSETVFLRLPEWPSSPPLLNNSRDPEQPEVRDHDFVGVVKNVFRLQVLVHDAFSVQIAHSLQRRKRGRCFYSNRDACGAAVHILHHLQEITFYQSLFYSAGLTFHARIGLI